MNRILKYHWLQLKNYWQHLRFRIRVEIIILFIIFFTFFSDKLGHYFTSLLNQPNTTELGLAAFILHILLLAAIIPTPFIYFNLFPKQKGLMILRLQPLSRADTLTILMVHLFKYNLIVVAIVAPVFTALTFSTGIIYSVYALFFFISFYFFSMLLLFVLINTINKKSMSIVLYYLIFSLYLILFYFSYWWMKIYIYYDTAIIIVGWIFLIKYWNSHWNSWDIILLRFQPIIRRSSQFFTKLNYANFPSLTPKSIRPFFVKDILGYLRNINYMRLKLISLFIYIFLIIFIEIYFRPDYTALISILTFLFIWEHYSHQFNEKYVMKEPRSIIKVLPIRYYQFSLAKFLSEFLFILLILAIAFFSMLYHGLSWHQIIEIIALITLFSLFVLYLITIIRVIFFDNPRFAGYAYHLMLIFTLVMSYNFYLVGPIITLIIIGYLQFVSYRQFVK